MNNKKGFTIVELAIVVAVITVLAVIAIPNFTGVIDKANRSAFMAEARDAINLVSMEEDSQLSGDYYILLKNYTFVYHAGIGMDLEKSFKWDSESSVNKELEKYDIKKYYYNPNCVLDFAKPADSEMYKINNDIDKKILIISATEK